MDWSIVLIIFNLIILEGLLSVDNAAVLAVMVNHLPEKQRVKALRYGLLGAYIFRGLCLLIASWLIKVVWLKALGGLYLLYLSYKGLFSHEEEDTQLEKKNSLFKSFWGTVVMVEIMDLAFSIDNVFAAVALSDKFWVIMVGVAIGILAMRFVAGWFVKLMDKYPSLATSAYWVIMLLGFKLIISAATHYIPGEFSEKVETVMENHIFDFAFSALMMLIFFVPLLKKQQKHNDHHMFI